ncbi:uncharacterized protein LOC121381273 [Gigantopelta aegis]|uniref:uncharacterized protein LOC121381273 n=1 Tax=Gigantopelta aegis TaxID=1735272 RepID=UPI001B88AA88|nr:uncharacterized protein LOC121381273 [Gigantopelta aegis]
MAVFACGCLNVKIHTKEFKKAEDEFSSEDDQLFLGKNVIEAVLDSSGVTMEHGYLVHCRVVADWTTFLCLNCNMQTHAVQPGSTSVLINSALESDQAVLDRLTRSSDFSSVFRIVLQNPGSDFASSLPDPRSHTYECLQSLFTKIQQQLNIFLLQEESAMEDRIRQFEQEQKAAFQELQNTAKSDKRKMISALILANQARTGAAVDGKDDLEQESRDKNRDLKVTRSGPMETPKSQTRCNIMRSFSNYEQSPDAEAMFYLDELEPELEAPFYDSDEEDKAKPLDDKSAATCSHQQLMYSSSVPISVPMWKNRSSSTYDEDDHDHTPSNPDQIAANMQALAQSITDNGRYIFGERPRPRLNTGDFMTLKR